MFFARREYLLKLISLIFIWVMVTVALWGAAGMRLAIADGVQGSSRYLWLLLATSGALVATAIYSLWFLKYIRFWRARRELIDTYRALKRQSRSQLDSEVRLSDCVSIYRVKPKPRFSYGSVVLEMKYFRDDGISMVQFVCTEDNLSATTYRSVTLGEKGDIDGKWVVDEAYTTGESISRLLAVLNSS